MPEPLEKPLEIETADAAAAEPEPSWTAGWSGEAIARWGTFLLLALGALYFARSVALPVAMAVLASLVLAPIVRWLGRVGLPPPLSAGLLLLALFGALGWSGVALSGPAAEWVSRGPESAREVERKLRFLRDPVARVSQMSEEVEKATQLSAEEAPRTVVVERRSLADVVLDQTQGFLVGLLMTAILLFFLLSDPDGFLERLVSIAPSLSDKKRVVAATREVQSEVSRYLLTISVINGGFGLAVGAALYALDVPNAALWGALAFVTNYVPYMGAFALAVVLAGVGVLSFDEPWRMFMPAGVFVALNVVESNLVTPMLVGRSLTLSPVVVFVWVLLWSWLWGVPGGLIAVPLLAVAKIAMQHVPSLAPVARLLG